MFLTWQLFALANNVHSGKPKTSKTFVLYKEKNRHKKGLAFCAKIVYIIIYRKYRNAVQMWKERAFCMKRAMLVTLALLLTACASMAAWLAVYHIPGKLDYEELEFDGYEMNGDVLTVRVHAELDGVYLYRVNARTNGDQLELTFRGGKQPALAQTKNASEAVFRITVPAEVKNVVCDSHTLYSVR